MPTKTTFLLLGIAVALIWCRWELKAESPTPVESQSISRKDLASEKTPAATARSEAENLIRLAQAQLQNYQTIRADVIQTATIGELTTKSTGVYISAKNRLHWELNLRLPDGQRGSLVEISDGDVLWNRTEILDQVRITRRDVRQIVNAQRIHGDLPECLLAGELGLGGLTGLLAGCQRSLNFDAMREEQSAGQKSIVVQARWKDELRQKLESAKLKRLPDHIPDVVRLVFDAETLFPTRILYLKRREEKLRPLMSLEFQHVVLDGPVTESDFNFTPPDGIVPEDITRRYLDLIKTATKSSRELRAKSRESD